MTEDQVWQRLSDLKGDPRHQLRASTRAVYERFWNHFVAWCEANDCGALPANPAHVAAHLMDRAEDGVSANTLRQIRNAISYGHRFGGHDSPTLDPRVKETLRHLSARAERTRTGAKQAVPLRIADIRKLRKRFAVVGDVVRTRDGRVLLFPNVTPKRYLRWQRDVALATVMWAGLLRAGEAAALRWADVQRQPDGKALLTLRKTKTSRTPVRVALPPAAVVELDILAARGCDPEARVFGLKNTHTVAKRLKRAFREIKPGCSGHSPRVGAVQDLTLRGLSTHQIQKLGRWRNPDMVAIYARAVDPLVTGMDALEEML